MALNQKEELRALDADERELVGKSHHPTLQTLSNAEVLQLVKLIRERRDRAKALAQRQRREMRGKATPRGATPASADEGSRVKVAVLAAAMRRLNNEVERRRRMDAQTAHIMSAQKALAMKSDAEAGEDPAFNSRTARYGMHDAASKRRKSLIRPMELGRQRKAGAIAQAKRDNRG